MALFGSTPAASTTSTTGDISKDVEIPQNMAPKDSVSDIQFSPTNDFLAVASWDGQVWIYEINPNSGVSPKWAIKIGSPVLCVAWSTDGTRIACGDTESRFTVVDFRNEAQSGEITPKPPFPHKGHDAAVKAVRWFNMNGTEYLATGSWDKTVKFWDLSKSDPMAGTLDCGERVYTMDAHKSGNKHLMVIGTAERHIHMVDLNNPSKIYKTITSPLKWQTRVVSCFADASGFAVGSIEGRCAIQYVDDKDTSLNFSFKCHRQADTTQRDIAKVYSVNAISFHPIHGTFSTAGSDGTFHFWDKDAKHRLKGYPEVGGSITATDFSRNGDIFAYAISYDWSKGYSANTPQYPIKIKLHPVQGDECKPRPGSKKR